MRCTLIEMFIAPLLGAVGASILLPIADLEWRCGYYFPASILYAAGSVVFLPAARLIAVIVFFLVLGVAFWIPESVAGPIGRWVRRCGLSRFASPGNRPTLIRGLATTTPAREREDILDDAQ